ncbi:MAG: P-type conjugative transfer protein VirB9 [Wolbachia sp.]|nr:P-type conjugative transfer protein VirB9 [Wolbachia sp.]
MSMCRVLFVLVLLINSGLNAAINCSNPISVDSRIKTFVYNPNEVFTVVFSQGYYSYIEFAEGEKIKNIAVGDVSSWKVNPYDNKLYIMPFEVSSRTNMIITTTKKRDYIFDLISRPNYDKQQKLSDTDTEKVNHDYSADKDISYIVRFYYPKTEDEFDIDGRDLDQISLPIQMPYIEEEPERVIRENDTKYNYTYIDKGSDEDIIPIELFDDGYLTYLKFKDNNKIPQILIEKEDKTRLPCKRLLFDGYVMIKGVHNKLFVRYKGDEVEIINSSM